MIRARARIYNHIHTYMYTHEVITSRENNAIYKKCIMGNNYQQQCVQQCHYCMNERARRDVWKSHVTSCQRPRVAQEDRWIAGASSTGRNTHPRIWSLGAGLHRSVYRVPVFPAFEPQITEFLVFRCDHHRIGWWENLQETPIFDGKKHGFL